MAVRYRTSDKEVLDCSLAIVPHLSDLSVMIALIVTTDPVTISFAQALLRDAEIECFVMDENMSVLEPGIMIPKRLMVLRDDLDDARQVLTDAGLQAELA